MMRRLLLPAVLSTVLAISACNFGAGTTGGTANSSESSSEDAVITRNVSYTGTLEDLGVSIYQQGTHKLVLSDGDFLLVESTDANLSLDSYMGKKVEIRGSVQSTVEAGGMLLRAEEVTVLDAMMSSESSSSSASSENESSSSSSVMPSSAAASVMKSSVAASSVPAVSSVSSAPAANGEMEAQIVLMAKQAYDTGWTQQYCTSHVALCIPAHKNWYFKSFGATTSNRWHVEFAMRDIDALGQGPIVLNLVSGTSASVQGTDGQVIDQGSNVIAYKDWNDGTHFEIIADARLKTAVQYMLSHITPYNPAQ